MSIKEILAGGGLTLVVLFTLIQIAPIKVNPWSWLGRLLQEGTKSLGRTINSEVLMEMTSLKTEMSTVKTEVATVQQKVEAMSNASDEQAAISARARILRFGDEVLHGQQRHSKDHFDSVLKDIKMYERYCASHDAFENGITEPIIKRIKSVYEKRLEDNDFL